MRESLHAPPVRYAYGRSAIVAHSLVALAVAGLLSLAAWISAHANHGDAVLRALVAAAVWSWSVVKAWRFWCTLSPGIVIWDGAQWWLTSRFVPQGVPLQSPPVVHLDVQAAILLSLKEPTAGRQWLWLVQKGDPLQWAALRRALYSRAQRRQSAHGAGAQTIDGMPSSKDGGAPTKI